MTPRNDTEKNAWYPADPAFVEPAEGGASLPVRIFAASRDGQTLRIAERIGERLKEAGCAVRLERLKRDGTPCSAALLSQGQTSLLLLATAVRYGVHLPEARRFLSLCRNTASVAPLALASVNLSARKPNRKTAADNPYLRKAVARLKIAPILAEAFAGRLDYPRYSWLDRQMIRLVMLLTGGPADGISVVEYTDWTQVDAFARRIATSLPGNVLSS